MLLFCSVIANNIYRRRRQSNSYRDSPWSNRRTRLSAAAAAAANKAAAAASSRSGSESILPLFLLFLLPRPMMVAEVDETTCLAKKDGRNEKHETLVKHTIMPPPNFLSFSLDTCWFFFPPTGVEKLDLTL